MILRYMNVIRSRTNGHEYVPNNHLCPSYHDLHFTLLGFFSFWRYYPLLTQSYIYIFAQMCSCPTSQVIFLPIYARAAKYVRWTFKFQLPCIGLAWLKRTHPLHEHFLQSR